VTVPGMLEIIAQNNYMPYFLACGVLLVVFIVLGFVLGWCKKKYDPRSGSQDEFPGLMSMDQLEEMRKKGMVTNEEFDVLRKKIIDFSTSGGKNDGEKYESGRNEGGNGRDDQNVK